MTDQVQTTSQTPETQVQELTPDELEHVGGGTGGDLYFSSGNGGVWNVDAADYVVWRKGGSL